MLCNICCIWSLACGVLRVCSPCFVSMCAVNPDPAKDCGPSWAGETPSISLQTCSVRMFVCSLHGGEPPTMNLCWCVDEHRPGQGTAEGEQTRGEDRPEGEQQEVRELGLVPSQDYTWCPRSEIRARARDRGESLYLAHNSTHNPGIPLGPPQFTRSYF